MKIFTDILNFNPDYDIRNISSTEEMLLFDIETTGLKKESTQLYLIGCGYLEDGSWKVRQWLTERASDEIEVIEDFMNFASRFKMLVHFNGDGFDIPYMRYKLDYYASDYDISSFKSFDIYKRVKAARRLLNMSSMSQKSVEEFLKIHRDDELNGGLLIPYYYEYEKTLDEEVEKLLLLHNHDDIIGMIKILPMLNYLDVLEGRVTFSSYEEIDQTAVFNFQLPSRLPIAFEKEYGTKQVKDILICGDGDLLQINIKIHEGAGKYPLKDIENYYYLPDEDKVIHKDVAQFVEKCKRKKATKNNCFIKKQGRFLPQYKTVFTPDFIFEDDKKRGFFELDNVDICADKELLEKWAGDILGSISSC